MQLSLPTADICLVNLVARLAVAAVCISFGLQYSNARAEPEKTNSRQALESEETTRLIKAEQPKWRIWKGADRQHELKFEPSSVLRWTNPGTGRIYGDLYFWTADGRPEAVMAIFKAWDPPDGFHAELHSLSLEALEADRSGRKIWTPSSAGIALTDVAEGPRPGETSARRLAQMRSIALDFEAVLTDKRRNNSGERQSLRLLTQPLFRYEGAGDDWIDGAVFAFVLGTDPELFLLIEARRSEDAAIWQYALARMNNDSMAVSHKRREVWRVERHTSQDAMREPYLLAPIPETP